ncbi:hypothetical protein WJX75_009575 [Coccomyxa subellipsoidea]|uniref:CR-type domain-containing protein n=1 Tax=Coccomyxa subellipsoidea TaxID=248742 RepID=A0ABR2YQG7_9CHLO
MAATMSSKPASGELQKVVETIESRSLARALPATAVQHRRKGRLSVTVQSAEGGGFHNGSSLISQSHPSMEMASISRVFIGVQPTRIALRLARRVKPNGPMSVLLVILTLISAAFAAIRARIVHNVRACSSCHGYGISRCSLCSGTGAVGWEGKWSHKEPCPMCVGRRFVECTECGGHYHRPMFRHIQRSATDLEEELERQTQPSRRVMVDVLED